ncbi:uncharacterized protein LOC106638698 [Copidosoma floridanum]|uniref:uncharacterized protein LOC106638698 n=1 Tax=Copidosoma floridanum TaxID=29053 RepID=UPI0006C961A1|nr:uncharacterized protein LOC106638698 [Copidosoma floridanum]
MGSCSVIIEINTERDSYDCKHCGASVRAMKSHLLAHACFSGLNTDEETIFLDRCSELFRGRKVEVPGIVDLLQYFANSEEETSNLTIEEFEIRMRELLMRMPERKRKEVQKKILSILFQPDELPALYDFFHLNDVV